MRSTSPCPYGPAHCPHLPCQEVPRHPHVHIYLRGDTILCLGSLKLTCSKYSIIVTLPFQLLSSYPRMFNATSPRDNKQFWTWLLLVGDEAYQSEPKPEPFHHLVTKHFIAHLNLYHPTQNHFTGDRSHDAHLDVLPSQASPLSPRLSSPAASPTPSSPPTKGLILSIFPSVV